MRYGSVCSGIEAATVAWEPLGWRPSFFSEIDKFPRAVLAAHYPKVPLHGDFTTIQAGEYDPIDLLVGGTPCQSFSVAGLRGGLADDRGNLALEYLRLAQRLRPKWLVWENVPGVLSSAGGRDFGSILGGLVELGYGFAYRVLDAQFFGVPQRRRRVFVVGYLGDWRRAAAVLFERHSLSGHSPPRREAGQRAAPTISARTEGGGGLGTDFDLDGGLIQDVAATLRIRRPGETGLADEHSHLVGLTLLGSDVYPTLDSTAYKKGWCNQSVSQGLGVFCRASGQANAETHYEQAPTLNCNRDLAPIISGPIAYALQERAGCENPNAGPDGAGYREGASYTLEARQTPQTVAYVRPTCETVGTLCAEDSPHGARGLTGLQQMLSGYIQPVAWSIMPQNSGKDYKARAVDVAQPVMAGGPVGGNQGGDYIQQTSAVRRLTPRECERLQGFPDDYTLISHRGKPAADGPRYKALGNSMAVPVMRWIGERIAMVEAAQEAAA